MNNQELSYFENWVRQEQIAYWLMALAMIGMSVVAFMMVSLIPANPIVAEGTTGTRVIEESPVLNNFSLLLFAMPAVWGLFILYWTSKREHVRVLTTNVLRQHVPRWLIFGLVFAGLGLVQFFTEGSILQRIILAPSLFIFGLFSIFRGIKLAAFRKLGKQND
jgi:hypothetical protein